jgi:hypothetical protein
LQQNGFDPLNNAGVKHLHETYLSISTGQPRTVILDPHHPTAATDLAGQVYLNPYPLGPDGGHVLDQLLVARAYIDHELGHELFTPLALLETARAISQDRRELPLTGEGVDADAWRAVWREAGDLDPVERAVLFPFVNVLEDARMERVVAAKEPYMWQRMLAGQLLQPKDGHARWGGLARLPDYEQVLWAAQLVGQANYTLTEDIKQGLSPEALEALREIDPLITKGVHGPALAALETSLEIVRALSRRGLLPDSPEAVSLSRPLAPLTGSPTADGQAAAGGAAAGPQTTTGEAAETDRGGETAKPDRAGEIGQPETAGRRATKGAGETAEPDTPEPGQGLETPATEDPETRSPTGMATYEEGGGRARGDDAVAPAADLDEAQREILRQQGEAALRRLRAEAAQDYRRAVRQLLTTAEKRLATQAAAFPPPTGHTLTLPLTDSQGQPQAVSVAVTPYSGVHGRTYAATIGLAYVHEDRPLIGRGAAAMARALKQMKQRVEKDAYLQRRGVLDRRRLSAAVKGSDRVRLNPADRPDTSMAVSMSFDVSGSMGGSERELGVIGGLIARGLEQADIPYELRVYNAQQYHLKAFEQRRIGDDQIAALYAAGGDNCDAPALALGGLALQTRPEAAKIQFILTDGEPQSFVDGSYGEAGREEVRHAVESNRAKGILTLGIFYAGPSGYSQADITPLFDQMYGPGNWAYVPHLEAAPKVVTTTLQAQLAKFLPDHLK